VQQTVKFLTLIFLCICQLSSCQTKKTISSTDTLTTEKQYILEGQFKFLGYDKLDHVYLVTADNEILQLKDDKILFRYSNRRLGDITKIDVSNPQKILVHYGDFYQVVFLDNTLSEIKRLDLEALGYWDVQGIALSRDNQIWFYDPVNVRLRKMTTNGEIQLSSNELYSYGFSDTFSPEILVADGAVYLYDSEGLKVFDEFGVWQKNIPLENEGLHALSNYLIYKSDKQLFSYSLSVEMQEPSQVITTLPAENTNFLITKEKLLTTDAIGYYGEPLKF